MDRSILKTGIPAAVVVSVLGFSMLFPSAVSQGNSGNHGGDDHGYGSKCGYGQVKDNDENDNHNGAGDSVKSMEKEKHDNDCNEDEKDGEGDGGGGGGGGDHAVAGTNLGSMVYATTIARHFRYPAPR